MKLSFHLDENDFLQHQLYVASKSKRVQNNRKSSCLIVPGTFVLLGSLFLNRDNAFLSYYFFGFGVISFLFYPVYLRGRYKRHYSAHVSDVLKHRFGKTGEIYFNFDHITVIDSTGEAKISLSNLDSVIGIATYFFVSLRTGEYLILPKSKLQDVSDTRFNLQKLCDRLEIPYVEDLNWVWK